MGTTGTKGTVKTLAVITAIAVLGSVAYAQNALQFTSVNTTPEKAIQLHWASNSNEVYEIDYADSLIDTNTGTITWNKLYDNYPSQGSNTYWLDTGNYNANVAHPKKSPMRFYQAVLTATNTSAANPTVSITSLTNGDVVSGNVTVSFSVSSSDPVALTKLYVDGEEMKPSDDGSNFVINTCEWWNGSHSLFVTAQSQSHFEGIPGDGSVTYGRGVSGPVNILFSNLISEVQFSQPYFQPSLGQTQEVTANFAANCDWTLQVQDVYGNAVRNASGSGSSLIFDWDGTGDGGTNIPDGHYSFFISASTNGAAMSMILARTPTLSDVETMWAAPEDAETPVPLKLYPPGFNTNSLNVFEASEVELATLMPPIEETETLTTSRSAGIFFTPMAAGAAGSSQDTTVPSRPGTSAGKGTVGTFYVGYQTYDVPGGIFAFPAIPSGNLVVNKWVILDNETSQSQAQHPESPFGSILDFKELANNFATTFQNSHWTGTVNPFIKKSDVEGGTFNNSNVGFLCCHGSYGKNSESDGVIRSYLRFFDTPGQPGSAVSSRLDDCHFGGAGTNGLKFMGLLVCNSLQDTVYNNLHTFGRLPISQDLHLLCGASTFVTAAPTIGSRWADAMLGDGTTNRPPITVEQSWFKAGTDAYDNSHGTGETNHLVMKFRVAGWPDAFPEHVTDVANNPSTGDPTDIIKHDSTVFNNP